MRFAHYRGTVWQGVEAARIAVMVLLLPFLVGCTVPVVRFAEPPAGARIERVFVAATPMWLPTRGEGVLAAIGARRRPGLGYGLVDVSIPPAHRPGVIEWPPDKADPERHFVVAGQRRFRTARELDAALRAEPGGAGGARLIYVHGFNNSLPEVVYRLAQMRADFEPGLPSVAYVWPSAGDPRGYIYDRDSVLYARDDFEAFLRAMSIETDGRVVIVAHSLGAFLTMETLRQIARRPGGRGVLDRIAAIVLMSPDIDPDLFRRQAEAIGRLPQPFFIFVARRDRILSLSSFLRGFKPQLGQISNADELAGLDVTVIDFTSLAGDRALDHAVPVTAPAAIEWLRRIIPHIRDGTTAFGRFVSARPEGALAALTP